MIKIIPLEIMTDQYNQYFIITEDVKKAIAASGIRNGMVTVEIWGTDVDGSTVRMGYDSYGLTAVTYRHVYDRDGNLLSSEQEAVSIYHPHEETHD